MGLPHAQLGEDFHEDSRIVLVIVLLLGLILVKDVGEVGRWGSKGRYGG